MKRYITPFSHANEILEALKSGILLTAKAEGQLNTMSISWGTLGIQWSKPVFVVYVRGCRHTKHMLDQNPEFTVNVPLGKADPQVIAFCGSKSGRDVDKFQALQLTPEVPDVISVPGIKEFPLTLECRVVYTQQQVPESFCCPHTRAHYPENSTNIHDDFHTAYYGEIVSAYIIEE